MKIVITVTGELILPAADVQALEQATPAEVLETLKASIDDVVTCVKRPTKAKATVQIEEQSEWEGIVQGTGQAPWQGDEQGTGRGVWYDPFNTTAPVVDI